MGYLARRSSVTRLLVSFVFCYVTIFALLVGALPQGAALAQERRDPSKDDVVNGRVGVDSTGELTSASYLDTSSKGEQVRRSIDAPSGFNQISDIEPNGTTATASAITTPTRVKGNLTPNGDIDFYSFTANAGDVFYGALMTSGSAGSSTDSQMTLIAPDGTTTIEFDDDNGSFAALSSTIAGAPLPSTGTYFVKVNDFTAGTTSMRGYELYVRLQSGAPTPEVEANDTPATANALPVSGWVSGTRNPAVATEQDWYSMNLNAGDTVYLSLDVNPERDGVVWNGRLGMALFGDASNQILVVDDAGTGDVTPVPNNPSEAIFMTVKSAGTYYAFVDSASAAVGGPTSTYNLSVTVFPKVNEGVNCTTYTSTNVPQTIGPEPGLVSSTITVPGNPRVADIDVSVQLNHTRMQDIDAHLRSPAGNDNGLFTDIGAAATGGQAQMDLTFDDEAGVTPTFTVLKGITVKPENNATAGTASTSGAYRLSWFDGENAGGTWTLDLRDDTTLEGGTLTGWSMTICEEPPPPACPVGFVPTTVFSTDFESGAAGFTHSGTADEWELGLPATVATTTANPVAGFSTCNSGVNCWKTDLDNTYNASSNQDLLSPNINLAGLSAPVVVTWAQRHQVETANFDHFFIDAQQVGGATPVSLYNWIEPTMISASAGTGNPQTNIGGSAGWGVFSRRADSLAGLNTELRFHVDSDTTVQFGGVAIDDVSVTACRAASADLSITKTDGVTSVTPGGSTTYTITASNAGPDPVTGATVADTFPASLTVASWSCVGVGGGTCTAAGAGNINDTNVNLPVGGSVTYTAMATVSPMAVGSIANTATVSSATADPVPANNSATDTDTVAGATADLSITKTNGVTTVTPGGSTTYTITASNAGPSAVTGATVADTFPSSLTVTGWTCVGASGGTCTAAGSGNINDTAVNLPSGGSVTYTATATVSVTATGTIANTATVSSSATDPNPGNNSATDTDTVGAGSQACTITSGGASYVIPATSHYDTTQTSNLTGVGTGDYLFEDGWWFRVSGDTAETFFPVPTGSACSGANGTIGWADVGNRGLFSAVNSLSIISASPNTGRLVLTMAVTNLSSTNPLTISLFHGADLDVNGTAGTDNATLLIPNNYMRVADTTAGFADYGTFTPAVNGYLVRPFAASTDVFGVLGDTGITNFDNTGLPTSSFDFTGGYQWDRVIPANGTATVSVIITANTPLTAPGVAVGGRVLTPEGRGVRGANVTITDQNGVSRTVATGVNGNFVFEDVEPGQTYVVNVRSRRFAFSPQVVQVTDNIGDLNFIAGQ